MACPSVAHPTTSGNNMRLPPAKATLRSEVSSDRAIVGFVHIEKCAGTSIIATLRAVFGPAHLDLIPQDKESMLFVVSDMTRSLRVAPFTRSIAGHSLRCYVDYEMPEKTDLRLYTLLRNPVDRYLSDFYHFVDLLGFPRDFERWLQLESRRNFITKSIAGSDDVEQAIRNIENHFALVGTVERYDEFLSDLAQLANRQRIAEICVPTNTASGRTNSFAKEFDPEPYRQQIVENNSLDIELYDHVVKNLQATSHGRTAEQSKLTIFERSKLLTNRLYRAIVYKPWMGYAPMKPHALPAYRGWTE